jgi:hypothetical protein
LQQVGAGAGAGQQVGAGAGQQALLAALRAAKRASRPHFFLAGGQQVGAGSQQVGAGAGSQQTGAGAGSQQTGAGAGAGAGAGSQQVGAGSQQVGAGAQQSLFALRQPNKPASLVGAKMTLRRATSPNANTDRIVVSTKRCLGKLAKV